MTTDTKKTIVLAFSGGLDTSYCVLELKAQGYDVHTVFVDTGGHIAMHEYFARHQSGYLIRRDAAI